ncbi:hypothetical protein BASA81_000916 [Batrachochytrium salamandrivorans]|nr:hypothetical protein BASA81_000916 [Batrachochytrium salamandrivorans]
MYDFRKQGVDYPKVALLFLKWPVYAFRLLRRGRFETIAELRADAYKLDGVFNPRTRMERYESDPDFVVGLRTTLTSPRTALSWSLFLLVVLLADQYVLAPELRGAVATLLAGISLLTVLVILSSITRESNNGSPKERSVWASNLLGGVFFLASTFPFAMPWVVAFFFPRQCLWFFTTWGVFGAVIGEVGVLVSRARLDAATSKAKKDLLEGGNTNHDDNKPIPALRKRTRKTTEQRIATTRNFTVDDRTDLEDYLVSDQGLKWWAAFLAMQGCISGLAVFLRLLSDVFLDAYAVPQAAMLLVSLSLFCESFWMTYAAGGRWLHFRKKWRFFQPFKGGARFILFQGLAWFFFFVFLLKTISDLRPVFHIAFAELAEDGMWGIDILDRYAFALGDWMAKVVLLDQIVPFGAVGLCGILAELFMMVSLPLFEGKDDHAYLQEVLDSALDEVLGDEQKVSLNTTHKQTEAQVWEEIQQSMAQRQRLYARSQFSVSFWELCADALRTAWLAPIVLLLVKPEVVLFLSSFALTKFVDGANVFGVTLYVPYVMLAIESLYVLTYLGFPRRSGSRRWWSLRGSWVYNELSAYWYSNIIRERELNANHKHVFGYHPHGLFPMGAMYVHGTTQWMNLFPGIVPFSLTSTVTHIIPLLKDVTQYLGGLEVTQSSFCNALMKFSNVLLVPGGQHEMLLGNTEDANEVLLSSKHKGFVRLALQAALENPDETINLVPIYVFGEMDMLYNGFPISLSMQRWLVAKLRLNPAFLPMGRFNLAGVPRRVPVTFCVGAPIAVPVVHEVTDAHVELLGQRYYSAIGETFDKHRELVAGFETSFVTFVPPLSDGRISKQDFETKWAQMVVEENNKEESDDKVEKKPKRESKDPGAMAEYAVAIVLSNLVLGLSYWLFANN